MGRIFDIIENIDEKKGGKKEARLGLRLRIGDREDIFPISGTCLSYEALEEEVSQTKEGLDHALDRARAFFRGSAPQETLEITPGMTPEEIWKILSKVADEDLFISHFNSLEESVRREVAEHVLTRCNIFAGKASIFSARYDNEAGSLL